MGRHLLMHLRPLLVAAAFLVAGTRVTAQEVLVEVVELANGKPIVGANVSLVDDHGVDIPCSGRQAPDAM